MSGYSQSKWVVETLLLKAKRERGLCVNVVRVGQLAGDTKVGGWNEKEWLPVMLRGSQMMGAFPERSEVSQGYFTTFMVPGSLCADRNAATGPKYLNSVLLQDTIAWIPVDTAASAVIDMIGSPEPVLHLVHPYPVPWTVVSSTASKLLRVPIVSYSEWLSMLQDAAQSLSSATGDAEGQKLMENPALKIFDFFEGGLAQMSELVSSTDKAVEVSRSLREAKEVGKGDVERWVGYWRKIGFLKD